MANGISPDFLEELKRKNDIVDVASKYITLNRRGANYWACCPFHNEKTPSFSIKQDGQFFKCFGCGESGNVITFVMKMENVDFLTAVELLCKNVGLEMPSEADNDEMRKRKRERERMYAVLKSTTEFYHNNLINHPNTPQAKYLSNRGINKNMIDKFQIGISLNYDDLIKYLTKQGFTPQEMISAGVAGRNDKNLYDFYGGRVMFPIFNGFGDVVAFSGRSVEANPDRTKYKNTSQTPIFNKSEILFGYNFVRDLKKEHSLDTIVIVEGHIDVIMCHQSGITNTIGCMGTALTAQHANNIKRLVDNVILCLDGDNAGASATYKAINTLKEVGLNVKVLRLTDAKDPDEYLKKFGKDAFYELLSNAQDCIDFVLIDSSKKYNMNSNNDKTSYLNEALNYISKFSTPAEQEVYLSLVQKIVKIPIDALRNSLRMQSSEDKHIKKEPDREIELGNNQALIQSKIALLASILYKKYTNIDEIAGIFTADDELSELYKFFVERIKENKEFNSSTLFDNFEITNNSLIDQVINYKFPSDDVYDNFVKETINTVKIYELTQEKDDLTKQMLAIQDIDKQRELLKKIGQLDKELIRRKSGNR